MLLTLQSCLVVGRLGDPIQQRGVHLSWGWLGIFRGDVAEPQRGRVTCLRSHSSGGAEPIFKLFCLIPVQPTFHGSSIACHFDTCELAFPLLLKLRSMRLCLKNIPSNKVMIHPPLVV